MVILLLCIVGSNKNISVSCITVIHTSPYDRHIEIWFRKGFTFSSSTVAGEVVKFPLMMKERNGLWVVLHLRSNEYHIYTLCSPQILGRYFGFSWYPFPLWWKVWNLFHSMTLSNYCTKQSISLSLRLLTKTSAPFASHKIIKQQEAYSQNKRTKSSHGDAP